MSVECLEVNNPAPNTSCTEQQVLGIGVLCLSPDSTRTLQSIDAQAGTADAALPDDEGIMGPCPIPSICKQPDDTWNCRGDCIQRRY
jgi:hypothetical protein